MKSNVPEQDMTLDLDAEEERKKPREGEEEDGFLVPGFADRI